MGLPRDRLIVELPFEKVYAVALSGDRLWVLADGQIAAVDLLSGTVETATDIAFASHWGGQLLALPDGRRVAYAVGLLVREQARVLMRAERARAALAAAHRRVLAAREEERKQLLSPQGRTICTGCLFPFSQYNIQ